MFITYHSLYPGQYWIDPNGGEISDAILVHCDMPAGASCIYPKPMTSEELTHTGRSEAWLSELDNGFTVKIATAEIITL